MFRRKLYDELLAWKREPVRENALLIEGARRVGKSTLVEEFARCEYRSYIIVDFSHPEDGVLEAFETQRNHLDVFFMYLSAAYGVTLHKRESLIIFDEVQLYPKAREFIKQLVADGRYDYIETGSLISIKRNVEGILIPSEEHSIELDPLDFEEFLWALGEKPLADMIRWSFEALEPLPDAFHRRALRLFREYMLVGGMPRAVQRYVDSHDLQAVDKIKRDVLSLYRKDIARYAKGYETKVFALFDAIPSLLSTHEKKFSPSVVSEGSRTQEYSDSIFWLSDARIVNCCYNSTDPHVGLKLYEERPSFKCYMADTGLLVTQSFSDTRVTSNELYRDILFGKLEVNEGMLVENVVAQQLRASGHRLFFYSRASRENASERMEIDFLTVAGYPNAAMRSRVSPIEVKSRSRYKTVSLDKFKAKFGSRVGIEYVLHPKELRVEGDRRFLPLYMSWCL